MVMKTNLELELQAQNQWQLKPQFQNWRIFEQLVYNEFLTTEQHYLQQSQNLQNIVKFAVNYVPYYRNLFQELGLSYYDIKNIDDLTKIPILSQTNLLEKFKELTAEILPQGEKLYGYTSSSGTTGRPKKVLSTFKNNLMFSILSQRNYRIAGFNPLGKLATIRWNHSIPRLKNDKLNPDGETFRLNSWQYPGQFFYTGIQVFFNDTNPIEKKLEWLYKQQPHHLGTYSGTLEHLALAYNHNYPIESLKSAFAISEMLTDSMEKIINSSFNIPVYQNYGLNEIGIIGMQCSEKRYHVHTEHCLVEIINKEGKPCQNGEKGRIIITGLNNFAMPLIRYDTDDIAIALTDPCPCGRTLPSFGKIIGRYRRYHNLPDNTLFYLEKIWELIAEMPNHLISNLRQYQLHQYLNNNFELRLLIVDNLPEEFYQQISQKWQEIIKDKDQNIHLKIINVEQIPKAKSGKTDYFTSDFFQSL
jgi:phenylacetate-CoA ligase